jgi:hypothetical protein
MKPKIKTTIKARARMHKIADFIKEELDIDVRENTSSRERHLMYARTLFFNIVSNDIPIASANLGDFLGKDHATVLHAFKSWNNHLREDYKDHYNKYFNIVEEDKVIVDDDKSDLKGFYVTNIGLPQEDVINVLESLKTIENTNSLSKIVDKLGIIIKAQNNMDKVQHIIR